LQDALRKRTNKNSLDMVERTTPPADVRPDAPAARSAGVPRLRPATGVPDAILRDWKRIALITVAATLFAWIVSSMQPPRYRASTLASVAPLQDALQANDYLRGLEVLERRTVVTTVAALAMSATTRAQVGAGADTDIQATVLPNTNLFSVDVEGGDAAKVAAIANRVAALMSTQTRAMYKYYGVTTIAAARQPTEPVSGRSLRAIAAGPVIGLLLGIVAACANYWRSTRRSHAA
jgi:capsular polysaccharide biosynthesis protein